MKKNIVFSLLLAIFSPIAIQAQTTPFWHQTNGPEGGGLRTMAIDSSGGIIVWTNASGVYHSSDTGTSWQLLNKGLPTLNMQFGASTKDNVLIGTDAYNHIYRLDEKKIGAQWENITPAGIGSVNVYDIVADPVDGNIYLAGYQHAVLRSSDNGTTWETKKAGIRDTLSLHQIDTNVILLAMDGQFNLYASSAHGRIFRSTDAGDSWTKLPAINPDTSNISTLAAAANGNLIIGNYQNNLLYQGGKVYVSTDIGTTWKKVYQRPFDSPDGHGGKNQIDKIIAVPGTTNIFVNAHGPTVASYDNGVTWSTPDTIKRGDEPFYMAGKGKVVFQIAEPDGAFLTLDSGHTWIEKNKSFLAHAMFGIALNSKQKIFGITEYGLFRSTNNGDDWDQAPEYGETYFPNLFIDKADNLFIGTDRGLFRSKDDGETLDHVVINQDTSIHNNIVIQVGQDPNGTLFCSNTIDTIRFMSSTNEGDSWTLVTGLPNNVRIDAFTFGSKGTILAASDGAEYYRSIDNGVTWSVAATNNNGTKQLLILADGSYLSLGSGSNVGIVRSTDGAVTWTSIFPPPDFPEFGRYFSMMVDVKGHVLVCTDSGIYRSVNATFSEWSSVSSGLTAQDFPNHFISATQVAQNPVDQKFYAASRGLSVFQSIPDFSGVVSLPSPSFMLTSHPNPFATSTNISFSLSKRDPVRIEIYDMLGKYIITLMDEVLNEGEHSINFDGANLPSGNYMIALHINGEKNTLWVTLTK